MRILLLGATGRTGILVLKEALAQGYEVNCLSRNSERIEKREGLAVFEGNPTNKADLEKAIEGCDFVLSVLNISRKSDFPWSKLRTPENYLSSVMTNLLSVVEGRRIIICSAWGTAETRVDIPKWFKWLIENSNIGVAYRDHEKQEELLANSNTKWTIVRPAGLTNSKKVETFKASFNNVPKPSITISRQSLAKYLVRGLKDEDLIGKKVVISKG